MTATARLVDLRTGTQIWSGLATAANNENNNNQGLVGMLVAAAVKQIVNNVSDEAHTVASVTSARLLSANDNGGILKGPRAKSPTL